MNRPKGAFEYTGTRIGLTVAAYRVNRSQGPCVARAWQSALSSHHLENWNLVLDR